MQRLSSRWQGAFRLKVLAALAVIALADWLIY